MKLMRKICLASVLFVGFFLSLSVGLAQPYPDSAPIGRQNSEGSSGLIGNSLFAPRTSVIPSAFYPFKKPPSFGPTGGSGGGFGPGGGSDSGFLRIINIIPRKIKISPQGILIYLIKGAVKIEAALNFPKTPDLVSFFLGTRPIAQTAVPNPGAPGLYTGSWDSTKDLGDEPVTDGYYNLNATAFFSNPSSQLRANSVPVIVDNNNPPDVVTITDPIAGAKISGLYPVKISVTAKASDLIKYELYVDGRLERRIFRRVTADGDSHEIVLNWESDKTPVGNYNLTATIYDEVGNSVTSAAVTVKVFRLPKVKFISPVDGSFLRKTIKVRIEALPTDSLHPITNVELGIDCGPLPPLGLCSSKPVPSLGGNLYGLDLNTATVADGSHKLSALATDSSGNFGRADILVTFDNTPPIVKIVKPPDRSGPYRGRINVNVSATDKTSGIASVIIKIEDNDTGQSLAFKELINPPYNFIWDSTNVPVLGRISFNGIAKITATAQDRADNQASDISRAFINNPTQPPPPPPLCRLGPRSRVCPIRRCPANWVSVNLGGGWCACRSCT